MLDGRNLLVLRAYRIGNRAFDASAERGAGSASSETGHDRADIVG